ncbi:MAG TPA: glycosyltransferase family 39 protein [Gemmatimonadaceae bacterium]
MAEPHATPGLPELSGRSTVALWVGVALVGALLPVAATVRWFNATHSATFEEVAAGVWILKGALIATAALGLLSARIPVHSRRAAADDPVTPPAARWAVAALLLLAAALRLYQLDTELWMDEIFLLTRYAPLEFPQLLSTYDSQNHQPLYSLLARLSMLALGGVDWSIRVPAAVLGVASLWAVWWLGRKVAPVSEALLAVAFLAVSYHHVWFSQNARGYTTILLLTVLTTGVFLRLASGAGPTRRLALVYAVLMALAAYTHLTAALIAVGHAIALALATRWRDHDARRMAVWPAIAILMSGLLSTVLYGPMLPQLWHQVTTPTMEGVAVEWTGTGWMLREGLRVLSQGIPGGLVTVAAALLVLAVGVWSYWRQSRLTTLVMFVPVVVTFAAIVATRHNLWPRFFFFAAAFFVLAALRGGFVIVRMLVRWHPDRVAIAGASAVAALSLLTVPRAWAPKQQFGAAYEFVESERQPGDEVVVVDIAAEVYELRGWAPTWHRTTSVDVVTAIERSAGRTWIVYTLPARVRAILPGLFAHFTSAHYKPVRIFPASVGGGEIHVLRHDAATSHD